MESVDLSFGIAIPVFMLAMGLGIKMIWTMDIIKGKFSHMGPFFRWTNDGGDLMWPHIIAEYLTAAGLIAAGIAAFVGIAWAYPLSLISLGALWYTSLNSLGWVFADKKRLPYGVPMLISLGGATASLIILIWQV